MGNGEKKEGDRIEYKEFIGIGNTQSNEGEERNVEKVYGKRDNKLESERALGNKTHKRVSRRGLDSGGWGELTRPDRPPTPFIHRGRTCDCCGGGSI